MRTITLNGNNITSYILTIPNIENQASDYGQIATLAMPNLVGDNRTYFYDINNPASPFYGAIDLSKYSVEIIDNGLVIFQGTIDSLQSDNTTKQANITLKSDIQRILEEGLIYASDATSSDPATMVREICTLYKIPVNSETFNRSASIYNADNVSTTAFFQGEGTILDGIQQIAEIGCARVYTDNNALSFDVFSTRESDPIATFSDDRIDTSYKPLYSHINPQNIPKEPINGYKVEWVGGFPATFGNSEKQGKTISGTYSNTVRIMTLQAAVWIGEKWLEYFSTPQNLINFRISTKIGRSLRLNYPVQLRYRGINTIVDISSIDNSNIVYSEMWGQTR
jgi:hypothetical protein